MRRKKGGCRQSGRGPALTGQGGSVLVGLIIVMVLIAVIAVAMVSLTTTSTISHLWANPERQARLLADSGYRFSVLKYSSPDNQIDRNDALKDLHEKRYLLSPATDNKSFSLEVTSHWFEAPANAYSSVPSPHIDVAAMGKPPWGSLTGPWLGYVKVAGEAALSQYSSIVLVSGSTYRISLTSPIGQTTMKQNVSLVCLVSGPHTLSEGDDLPVQYGAANNGIYLFPNHKAKIKINDKYLLTYDSVDYDNKVLKGLRNIPGRADEFPFTVANGDQVVLWPFFQVESTGNYKNEAKLRAAFGSSFNPIQYTAPKKRITLDDLGSLPPDVTKHGGVTETAGVIGKAALLEAAASGYLEVANPNLEMSGIDRVSVAAWVKKTSAQTFMNWVAVVQKSDYSYNLQFEDGNEPVFTIWDGADRTTPGNNWKSAKAGFSLNNDEWYYLVGTFDSADPGTVQQVYTVNLNLPDLADRSLDHRRCLIPAANLVNFSGKQLRVKFEAHPSNEMKIDLAYIGERSGTTWDIKGSPPKVQLTFNHGNDNVTIPAGGFVWSDWVNFPTDGTNDLIVSFDYGDSAYPKFASGYTDRVWLDTDGAALDSAPALGTDYFFRGGVSDIEAGSGENVKIYVDGELKGTAAASQLGDATGWNVGIGSNLDTGNRFLDGAIDDVRIYNRALLPEEIMNYYLWYTPK